MVKVDDDISGPKNSVIYFSPNDYVKYGFIEKVDGGVAESKFHRFRSLTY